MRLPLVRLNQLYKCVLYPPQALVTLKVLVVSVDVIEEIAYVEIKKVISTSAPQDIFIEGETIPVKAEYLNAFT